MVAIVRASPRKRWATRGPQSSAGGGISPATARPSTSSVPRHTSPMPPLAIRSSSLYRPPSTVPPLTISTTSGSRQPPLVQHGLHHVAADPGSFGAAVGAGVLEEYRDRTDRVAVLHDETNEPPVVAVVLTVLRRSGLAADLEARDLRLGTGAVVDHALHHLLELAGRVPADRRAEHLRLGLVGDREVRRLPLVHQVRPHLLAAVGHRRGDQGALHRGDLHVELADPGLPDLVRVALPLLAGHGTGVAGRDGHRRLVLAGH